MSIEKQAEALLVALTNLLEAVTAAEKGKATTTAGPGSETKAEKKATKAELKALAKDAKQKAGKILKEKGMEILGDLLGQFGAKKFSGLKAEPGVYEHFIKLADAILDGPAGATDDDDDLLGDGPADEAVERTLEDVKGLLLKVNNHEDLGKAVTRQILAGFGAQRLGELKKENFAAACDQAQTALDGAL